MSGFADKLMVRYTTPANVDQLLVPVGDTQLQRVRTLLQSVYEMRDLEVKEVTSIEVLAREFQAPIVEEPELRGSWERIYPQSDRTVATFLTRAFARTTWLGMMLSTRVTVKVAVTEAALERVESEDLTGVTSLADLQAKFLFVDVNDLMSKTGVTTLQQLKADFPRLFRLRFAQPPAYDPNDPTVVRRYRLRVGVLFEEQLDLQLALRDAKDARRALELVSPHVGEFDGGDVLAGSAWMVVFPAASITGTTPQQVDVTAIFAAEGFVAAFETP